MQKHLVEYAAENIAVAGIGNRNLNRFGNCTAEGARGAGMLCQNLSADLCGIGGGGNNRGAVGSHDFTAEGLLLIADFDHIDLAVQPQIRACHRESRAPLAGTGLGGDALETLFFSIIGLGDS